MPGGKFRSGTAALMWGRGTGKSHLLRTIWWLLVSQYDGRERAGSRKGVRIVVPMPTLTQFRDVHGDAIVADLDGDWKFLGGRIDRTRWHITFPGGSYVKPFPAAEHTSRAARGIRCDVATPDEVDDIDQSVWHGVAIPWFSEPWSLNLKIAAGTPRRGRYGLLSELFDSGRNPDFPSHFSHYATYRDAPETVSADAVAEAKRTMPPSVFEREWEANRDAAEGLVYPFDESFHVREPGPGIRFTEQFVGVDHGWSDPGVFLHIGISGHGEDAIVWVLDEEYHCERPNAWWDRRARAFAENGIPDFFCDPSRPDRIADLTAQGCAAIGADNSIDAGVARVANLLFKRPLSDGRGEYARLFIHPRCVNTIREFGLYRRKRDPRNRDAYLEDIEDRNNHALDALRYAIVSRFGKLEYRKHVASGR